MRQQWIVAAGLVLAMGCGGERYRLAGVGPAAGADVQVAVRPMGDGERQVRLQVSELPPPNELGDGYRAYHVWAAPLGESPVLLGQLEYDEETRVGRLDAVTSHEGFRLVVTPEPGYVASRRDRVVVCDQYLGT